MNDPMSAAKTSRMDQIVGHTWSQAMVTHMANGRYICVMCLSPVFRHASQGEILLEEVSVSRAGNGNLLCDGRIVSSDLLCRNVAVADDKELAQLMAKYRDIQSGIYVKEPFLPWNFPQKMVRRGVYPKRHSQPVTMLISKPYTLVVHHNIGKESIGL